MNDFGDPRLAAIERRLERRPPAEPPPALRHRVLMAVDDVEAPGRTAQPALVERLRAAGLTDDDLLALATAPPAAAGPLQSEPDHPRPVHPARRLFKARALLEEHL